MSKYIDAEKLKAEIDKKWKELADKNVKVGGGKYDIEISTYLSIKNLIDSLRQEQPEADFEKEYKSYMESRKDDLSGNAVTVNMKDLARYFWNKGLNARKEE